MLLASNASLAQASSSLVEADGHQRRSDGEGIFNSGRLQPSDNGLFGIGLFQGAQCRCVAAAHGMLEQAVHAIELAMGFGFGARCAG